MRRFAAHLMLAISMSSLAWSGNIFVSALMIGTSAILAARVFAADVFVSTVVIGMSTRAGGSYTFSNTPVPTGVRGLQMTMDISEATDPLPALSATLEGSLDGGTTWISAGAFSRSAGPKGNDRFGNPLTTTGGSFLGGDFWNATTNPNRVLRGSASIGGTMRFALTVRPL